MTTHYENSERHYLSGTLTALWGNAAAVLGGLLTIGIASRCLTKEAVGIYYIILMMANLSIAFTSIGGRSVIVKILSGTWGEEQEHLVDILVTIRVAAIMIISIGLAGLLMVTDYFWPAQSMGALKWFVLPIVVMEIVNTSSMSMLAGFGMFKSVALFQGIRGVFTGIVSALVIFAGYGLPGLLWSILSVNICVSIFIGFMIPLRFSLVWEPSEMVMILKFSGMLYLAYLMSVLSVRTAELMVFSLLGTASVAVFGNAMQFPNILIRIFEVIRPAILGYFSSARDHYSHTPMRMASVFIALAASAVMVAATPLTELVFSEQYLSCVPITRLLCFWVVLSLINYFLVIHLIGTGMLKKVLWVNAIQLILVMTGHVLLIPEYGIMGAGLSITVAASATVPISLYLLARGNIHNLGGLILASFRPVVPLFLLLMVIQTTEPGISASAGYWVLFVIILFLTRALRLNDLRCSIQILVPSRQHIL